MQTAKHSGNAGVEANANQRRFKSIAGVGHFEPRLTLVKYPKCAQCGEPNPFGAKLCAGCGEPAPEFLEMREVEAVVCDPSLFPWHARALLAVGAFLSNLAHNLRS